MESPVQPMLELMLPDSGATDALGAALAATFPGAGAAAAVLCLHGELGAGKSSCARSLLRALGVHGTVRSPTYTLVETYLLPGLTCIHADLYRLQDPAEFDELGVTEFLGPGHLLLIEWSERGGSRVPAADLDVTFAYREPGRLARIVARSGVGEGWLRKLAIDARIVPYLSNFA